MMTETPAATSGPSQAGGWHADDATPSPLDPDNQPQVCERVDVRGEAASTMDPETWTDFETVAERLCIATMFGGIGYVFAAEDRR